MFFLEVSFQHFKQRMNVKCLTDLMLLGDFNAIIGLAVVAWGAAVTPHCCDCSRTFHTIVSQGARPVDLDFRRYSNSTGKWKIND